MKKAVLFDLDGTVSNTLDTIAFFGNAALAKHGIAPIETEAYKVLVGDGAKVLVKRMLAYRGAPTQLFETVYADYVESYDRDAMYLTRPYDGILEVLDALCARGIKTAVLTNKPHDTAVKIVQELFGKRISYCRGVKADGIKKPSPDGVLEILSALGVTKDEAVYVGDTNVDMATGKGAGLFTVGVLWGFRDRAELESGGADAIIAEPKALLEFLE